MASIFYATESDFFQTVKSTKTTVTIRPVKSELVKVTDARTQFDYDVKRRALRDQFTTSFLLNDKQNENGKRCKVQLDGAICINSTWRVYAYPCDEVEEFEVYYG